MEFRHGLEWGCGAAAACVLLLLAAPFALKAGALQLRLHRALAAEPVRLPVDFSRPSTYSAAWNTPDYGDEGLELELVTKPPLRDASRDERLRVLGGNVAYEGSDGTRTSPSLDGADLRGFPLSIVPRDRHAGAYLWLDRGAGAKPGRLTLTVLEPAPFLAGRDQELVVRPMLDYNSAYPIRRICWLAAAIGGGLACLPLLLLVWKGRRRHRAALSRHPG